MELSSALFRLEELTFELGDSSCFIPIGDVDVGVTIDKTTVCSAEDGGRDVVRIELVSRPLCFKWIVS